VKLCCLLIVLGALAGLPSALNSPETAVVAQQAGTAVVGGVVIDAITGEGISRAAITLAPSIVGGSIPAADYVKLRRAAVTDASGRFTYQNVAAGSYNLSASADGYVIGGYGRATPEAPSTPLAVLDGARLTDLAIRMWKVSSISGVVTTASGEAIADARLSLWQRFDDRGPLAFSRRPGNVSTDSAGRYRFTRLPPGRYVVGIMFRHLTYPLSVQDAYHRAATSRGTAANDVRPLLDWTGLPFPSGRGIRIGEYTLEPAGTANDSRPLPPLTNGEVIAYRSTFARGARRAEDADVVVVRTAETHSNIDLQIPPERTFTITGVARDPTGPAAFVGLRLVLAANAPILFDPSMEVAATVTDEHGVFRMLGVPEGQYLLVAMLIPPRPAAVPGARGAGIPQVPQGPPVELGKIAVTVDKSDVTGLSVSLSAVRRLP